MSPRPVLLHLLLFSLTLASGGCTSSEPPPPAAAPLPPIASAPQVTFTDVTSEAGITFRHVSGAYGKKYLPETMGAGVAVLDFDGDGRPDLYFPNGTLWPDDPRPGAARPAAPLPSLYRNNGDGTFTESAKAAGLASAFYGMGATSADYDNDGDADLFVTALGPDRLYRNDSGHFTEIGARAGVADPGFGSSAAFLDYDHDGDADLFVCNYVQWTMAGDLTCTLDGTGKSYCTPESYKGESNRLFRNDGGDRFTDISRDAGVFNPSGKSLGVVVTDFDGDGWEDIAVANDTQPNYLYKNMGDGTFTDVGREAGIAFSEAGVARGAMGIDAADYDHSGRESLVVGNFANEMVGLYHNEGMGLFIDDAPRAGIGLPSLLTLAFGCFFFDYDLDGHLDIFVANGHVEDDINRVQKTITYAQRPHLFRNLGGGSFATASPDAGAPFSREVVARGAASLDYDGDGDLDIVMTLNNGPAALLRNNGGNQQAWVRVRLEGGVRATRDGLGARIRVTAGGRTQSFLVKTASSYCSQPEMVATFGLGEALSIENIAVVWPSGETTTVPSPAIRSTVVIKEPAIAR